MVIENGGTLVWNAPADFTGPEKVVVLVENRAGESTYHNFELLAN
jgi:hypothetical protein